MRHLVIMLFFVTHVFAQTSVQNAKALMDANKPTEAKQMLLAIKKGNIQYAEAQFFVGQIEYNAKRFEEASVYFEEAIAVSEKVAAYHLWLGNCYGAIAQNANVIKQAYLAPKMKSEWERALQLDASLVEARFSLIAFYTQAPSFMGGSMEKAKDMAREIIKTKPADGHIQLGNIYLKEENLSSAEKEFATASKVNPMFRPVLGNFYVNQKKYDEAFRYFESLLAQNPKDYVAMFQLGRVSAISGKNLQRGADLLTLYLIHKPESDEPPLANANFRLGEIYEKLGKPTEAKKHFESALVLDATLKGAKEGLARVSKK